MKIAWSIEVIVHSDKLILRSFLGLDKDKLTFWSSKNALWSMNSSICKRLKTTFTLNTGLTHLKSRPACLINRLAHIRVLCDMSNKLSCLIIRLQSEIAVGYLCRAYLNFVRWPICKVKKKRFESDIVHRLPLHQ